MEPIVNNGIYCKIELFVQYAHDIEKYYLCRIIQAVLDFIYFFLSVTQLLLT